jgi:hypothetical protein
MSNPEPRDPAKNGFLILQFMRLSGAAFVLFGAAIAAGKITGPPLMGYGLMLLGGFEALIMPGLIARKWKSPDSTGDKD